MFHISLNINKHSKFLCDQMKLNLNYPFMNNLDTYFQLFLKRRLVKCSTGAIKIVFSSQIF